MDRMRLGQVPRALVAPSILVALAVLRPCVAGAFDRVWQPIVIRGAEVPSMLGARENQIELTAIRDGALVPIPFQVDERLPDGSYALDQGAAPRADDSPGILDQDDEIVAMVSDFGVRAGTPAKLARDAVEIELDDPLGGAPRYAYASVVEHPKLSATRYVDYDSATHTFETDTFRVGFSNELETDFAVQSARNSHVPNLIDRFKVRISAKVLGIFNFKMTEDDIEKTTLAWHAGPIRVVRALAHRVRLGFGLKSPEVTSTGLVYRRSIESPFIVSFPWVPRVLFGGVRVRMNLDFVGLDDFKLMWSGMQMAPIGARDSAAIAAAVAQTGDADIDWVAVRGSGATVVRAFTPSTDLATLHRRLYLNDSPEVPDPPESVLGENPGIGFTTLGWEDLSRGRHSMEMMLAVLPANYDPAKFYDELAHPLVVSVRPAMVH